MASTIDWRYFPHVRAELLIASSRCVLASFSLLAIWLDPSEPSRYAGLAYGMMAAYVIYSLAVAMAVWRIPSPARQLGLITHGFDLVIFTVFMFFTDGATSPFFVYFIFSVICGTVRWKWRGSLYTAVIALAAFLGLGFYTQSFMHDPSFELNRFIIRSVYLAVTAMLLSYAGAHHERMWNEITALAAWPGAAPRDERTLIRLLLEHASTVLSAPRVLMVWEESEEPWLNVAFWSRGEFELTRERPDIFGNIVAEPLTGKNFLCPDARSPKSGVLYDSGDGFRYYHVEAVLDPELHTRYAIGAVLSLKLEEEHFKGRLFILDKRKPTSDDLVLGKILAYQIAMILNQHYLLEQLHHAGIAEGRMRLARDLHDGLLQSLAGIAIKVHAAERLMDRAPASAHKELLDVSKVLSFEQRDLRCLIQELKPFRMSAPGADASLSDRLNELIEMIKDHWQLQVEFKMRHDSEEFIPCTMKQEVYFILREALVNCAKHANASTVCVDVGVGDHRIYIAVADNGRGFPYQGRYDHAALCFKDLGPVTIRERVAGLGGTLMLDSKDSGACIEIVLPLKTEGL